jgi:hypothetical protein
MYLCCSLSLSLIISTFPVDVGDLPNHVILCQCAKLSMGNNQNITGQNPQIPIVGDSDL